MGLTTKEIGSSSFNDMISSVDRRSEYVENRAGANVTLNNFLTPYTLDNKSSILNAPCGYSNGMYASLRPVQTIGPELVTNGNFDTDSDWTKDSGWSISGGLATRTNTGSYGALYQNCLTNGKKYKVTITISSITSQGFFGVRLGTNYILQGITEAGTYTATGTSTSTTLSVMGNPTFAGSIDSISIKEVTDADFDFTRGSSATRVNEKGLIEDVQILSGELVQNGDFEQIGSELVTNGNFATDSDWTKSAQSSISDGKARILSTDGSYQFIAQTNSGFTNTQGKFVKITLDIVEYVSGTLKAQFSGGTNYNLPQSVGTHTLYVKNDGSTGTLNLARVAGQTDITIDNVSVKEVGQNWTFVGEAEFTANGARIYSSSGDQSYINQPILTNTKKYKISYEIIDSTQGSLKLINVNGLSDYPIPSTVGTHTLDFTANNPTLFIYRNSGATDVTIDNVSVIEITDDTDIPRIDYTSGFGALLLEPQSTNKVTYSEDFSDGMRTGWTLLGSVQANSSSSPDGLTNATKFTRTDTQYNLLRVSASTLHVTSVFVKNIDANNFYIRKSAASYAYYNFDTKTVNDNSLKVEYFSNDWIRLSLSTDETSYRQFGIGQSETDLSEVGNSVYVWGAQLEQGSYATSYIPTSGSTVTRSADVANNSGNANLINSTEGVLYAEIAALANSGNKRRISLSDGTQSNGVVLALDAQDDRVKILIKSGGTTQANSQSAVVITATDFNKIAIKYKENDFALWVNGTEVFVDSSGLAPIGLNKLAFDFDSKSNFYGNVKALAVFKEVLTDAELAQITSATQQEVFYEMRDRMLQINADYYEFDDYTTRLKKLF